MPNPIELLISPLGCLISHSVIFIFSCIILIMWFSGTVVNPWSPVLSYLCASTFCLIIAIKQYQRASDIIAAQEAENDATDDADKEETTGGYETFGGDYSTTGYKYPAPVESKASNINVTQNPSYRPTSQQTVSAPELKNWAKENTSVRPTIRQLATEKPQITQLANSEADIKSRMSPSYLQANDMSDMDPNVNFFPDK